MCSPRLPNKMKLTLTRTQRSTQPDAELNVSRDWLLVERSKCERHKLDLPVPLTPKDSAQLVQGNLRYPFVVQWLD